MEYVKGYVTKCNIVFLKSSQQSNILLICVYMPTDDNNLKDTIIIKIKGWIQDAINESL